MLWTYCFKIGNFPRVTWMESGTKLQRGSPSDCTHHLWYHTNQCHKNAWRHIRKNLRHFQLSRSILCSWVLSKVEANIFPTFCAFSTLPMYAFLSVEPPFTMALYLYLPKSTNEQWGMVFDKVVSSWSSLDHITCLLSLICFLVKILLQVII